MTQRLENPTWFDVDGDNTYALDWPLTKDSVVVEVGGYEGRWSSRIAKKYGCTLHVYEPQKWAYEKLLQLGLDIPNYNVHNYAIGDETKIDALMGEFGTDACSFLVTTRERGTGSMVRADMALYPLSEIDLMMINIEGYEFKLLLYMIECGLLKKVKRLCVQWHLFADPDGQQYEAIKHVFDRHYHQLWSFFPTLEAWERN